MSAYQASADLLIDERLSPVNAAQLASRLRLEHPDILENWNALGTLKAFFRSLRLSRLQMNGHVFGPEQLGLV